MDRLQAMQVFVTVAETASFSEAARRLNMSPAGVTRAIAFLEAHTRVSLFTRTTRIVKLTDAGMRYVEDCRRILLDIAEADAAAVGAYAEPGGALTVTASALFGQIYVQPILQEFLDLYPGVVGRTLFVDRVVSLIDEGMDVAIRIGHLADSGLSATRVGSVRRVVCGAPDYFARRGAPDTPADLAQHRLIAATSAWASLEWRFGGRGAATVAVSPALFCNTYQGAIDAATSGWGLTRALSYQIAPALQAGALVCVLSEYEEAPLPIHVVHPEGRRASAKVRAFVDLAVSRLRANRAIH